MLKQCGNFFFVISLPVILLWLCMLIAAFAILLAMVPFSIVLFTCLMISIHIFGFFSKERLKQRILLLRGCLSLETDLQLHEICRALMSRWPHVLSQTSFVCFAPWMNISAQRLNLNGCSSGNLIQEDFDEKCSYGNL